MSHSLPLAVIAGCDSGIGGALAGFGDSLRRELRFGRVQVCTLVSWTGP